MVIQNLMHMLLTRGKVKNALAMETAKNILKLVMDQMMVSKYNIPAELNAQVEAIIKLLSLLIATILINNTLQYGL